MARERHRADVCSELHEGVKGLECLGCDGQVRVLDQLLEHGTVLVEAGRNVLRVRLLLGVVVVKELIDLLGRTKAGLPL